MQDSQWSNTMKRTDLEYWRRCCDLLHWAGNTSDLWHSRLVSAYSEPQRSYHTLQHLEECLNLLDLLSCEHLELVEVALWFHDAVYDPKAKDNEERSAELARTALIDGSVAETTIAEVQRLIMLTKSHQPGAGPNDAVLLDIDLAILGHSEDRFGEYEQQIRQEYSWVPNEVYRAKRAEVLAAFLQRQSIFLTPQFHELFEARARANLYQLISSLA